MSIQVHLSISLVLLINICMTLKRFVIEKKRTIKVADCLINRAKQQNLVQKFIYYQIITYNSQPPTGYFCHHTVTMIFKI